MGVLGGHWGFLTGDLEDRVILDILDHIGWPPGRFRESLILISLLEVCQEPPVLEGDTWRMLMVPDRRLGGQGNPWCHGSSWLTPMNIRWKFHIDIFIRSVSGTPCPWWRYLKDVDWSWLETWRTKSSFMSLITLENTKEDVLKVTGQYLYFWLIY